MELDTYFCRRLRTYLFCFFKPKWILSGGRDKNALGEIIQNFFGASDSNKWVTVRLWDLEDGKLNHTFAHHSNDGFSVAFISDGAWLASASEDKTVTVWHISQGE